MSENKRVDASKRRRQAVLAAAANVFAESGYKKAKTAEIARRAGVSKGLIFHLFQSKEVLFRCVVEDSLAQWRRFSEYRAYSEDDDIQMALNKLFMASFDFVEQHPILSMFALSEDALVKQYEPDVVQINRQWRRYICGVIQTGIERGVFQAGLNAKLAADIFHELQMGLMQNDSPSKHDRERVQLAIDVFVRGISN